MEVFAMGSIRSKEAGGNLFFDFRYQGKRCREFTLLPDTPANRRKLDKVMQRIENEIAVGVFDYAAYFPNSRNLKKFIPQKEELPGNPEELDRKSTRLNSSHVRISY